MSGTAKAPTSVTPQMVSRILKAAGHDKAQEFKSHSPVKSIPKVRAGFRVAQHTDGTRVTYETNGYLQPDHRKITLDRYVRTLVERGYRAEVVVDAPIAYVLVTLPQVEGQEQPA